MWWAEGFDFIYDCSDAHQAKMDIKTTKEIAKYAGCTCKHSVDIRKAIKALEVPMIILPADPPANATAMEVRIWEKKVDTFIKCELMLEQNLETMYSVILGQCTDAMRAKLESQDEYKWITDKSDAVELLKLIRGVAFNFQSQKYNVLSLHESVQHFYVQCQGEHMTCQAYLEQFNNNKDIVEHCRGTIGAHPGLIAEQLTEMGTDWDNVDEAQLVTTTNETKEAYMVVAFLMNSDRRRFRNLLMELENNYLKGSDKYPRTMTSTYNLLVNWKQDPQNMASTAGTSSGRVAFTNVGDNDEHGYGTRDEQELNGMVLVMQGQRGRHQGWDKSHITCLKCGKKGHYTSEGEDDSADAAGGNKKDDTNDKEDRPELRYSWLLLRWVSLMARTQVSFSTKLTRTDWARTTGVLYWGWHARWAVRQRTWEEQPGTVQMRTRSPSAMTMC